MTRRPLALFATLGLLALPAVAVVIGAASHHFANRTSTLVSSGEERRYILYVPKSHDPARPAPLVISLHGAKNWPAFQREVSGWNRVADEHGFLVAYPQGEGTWSGIWTGRGRRMPSRMPDVVFVSELIDRISASYKVDPARIYVNGLSNGAGMTFVLSCTLSHRIAAVGLVASALLVPFEWCPDTTPVPAVIFHGTADFAPYHGGRVWMSPDPFASVPEFTAKWARRNRCAPQPAESRAASDVVRIEYAGCAGSASVVHYRIEGGGHTWPGGMRLPEWLLGRTTDTLDASRVMWEFFRAHPRS